MIFFHKKMELVTFLEKLFFVFHCGSLMNMYLTMLPYIEDLAQAREASEGAYHASAHVHCQEKTFRQVF